MTTYRRIAAVKLATDILKYLGEQREPVQGQGIASALDAPHGTVMCHLVTLEDAGFVQRVGDHWRVGMGLALIWARVKSNLEGQREKISRDLASIAIEGGE